MGHPITTDKREAILVDWRMGKLSQFHIADKHKVSAGSVNKICKGIAQDGPALVNAGIEYNQALIAQNEMMVNEVNNEVTVHIRRMKFFDGAQLSLARVALERVIAKDGTAKEGVAMTEIKAVSEVVNTSRTGIMPAKTPGVAIQINTNAAYALPEYQQALRDVLDAI